MGILEFLKTSSCEQIEAFCHQQFNANVQYFRNHYPNLAEFLQTPAKEYKLHIGTDGINIFNFIQNTFMFPIVDGKSTMLDVHETCAYNPPINEKWHRIIGSRGGMMEEEFQYSKILVNGILTYASENGAVDAYHLPSDFLPSLNLFGLGGGIFLQILAEKYSFIHNFLIFEESLDLFRISCFFVDFALLFSKTQQQAGYIFLESIIKREYITNFFLMRRISSAIIRFELVFYQTPVSLNARELVFEAQSQTLRGWGTFEDEMRGIRNKLSCKMNTMLIEPKRVNAPICVIANGPSLDFLLPFIKENQDKMILFSCGTALKPLLNYGIKPDFQIEIERHEYLDKVLEEAPLGDIPLLCASVVDKKAKKVAKEIYYFEREGSSAANLNAPIFKVQFTSPLVGNAGTSLACYLGSDVVLCGLDCGYKKGAKKHATNSYYGDEDTGLPSDAFPVAGNFSDDIYSDPLFSLSKSSLEEAFSRLKPFHILNLNDGAKLEGATPIHFEDFELKPIKKKTVIKQLKSLFRNPYEENFYTKKTEKYLFEILAFKNKIHDIFKKPIDNKKSLFLVLDVMHNAIAMEQEREPFISILFGGSLSHFLYATALAALHLPHDHIQELWNKAGELYLEGMDGMLQELRSVLLEKVEH